MIELILTGSANLLHAAVFLLVGAGMWRRFSTRSSPLAAYAFVAWWFIMAAQALVVASAQGLTYLGWASPGAMAALFLVSLLLASAQIWALGHYVLYLWGGYSNRIAIPVALFSVGYFTYFLLLAWTAQPNLVAQGRWFVGIEMAGAVPHLALVAILFLLPVFALIAAFYLVAFEASTATQRTRVLVLGTAAALWNLAQVGRFTNIGLADSSFMGFLVAANLLWALFLLGTYAPTRRIRRWLGLADLETPARAGEPTPQRL